MTAGIGNVLLLIFTVCALLVSSIVKKRIIPDKQRTDRHLDPFWDHFGADTGRSSQNFGFLSQMPAVSAPNRFRNRSGCIFRLVIASAGFQSFRIISTPLGRTPKVVLGCSQAQKNMRGATITTLAEH